MKWFARILLLLLVPTLQAQDLGRAQGFPADPVISAAFFNDSLYLGTQGSGVYVLLNDEIRPSKTFVPFRRNSVYAFDTLGQVPITEGVVSNYPISVKGKYGTLYTITDGNLKITYSDEAHLRARGPSGIWTFTTDESDDFPEGVHFVRVGQILQTLSADGNEIDAFTSKGLIFDIAQTSKGLLLSTESGIYLWQEGWKSFYSGMPVFRFDGPKARTPLGHIALEQLLSGLWTMDDFQPMPERQSQASFFDIDTINGLYYGFGADGLEVFNEEGPKFTLGMSRGLPAFRPGNYDVAIIGEDLLVATPMGLWSFHNQGWPNALRHIKIDFSANGLAVASFENLEVEPASIGFTTLHKKSSSSRIYGRYRINNDPWNSFNPGQPVIFVRPAPGKYTLDIQTSYRLDFEQGMHAHYEYQISAWWYKRPIFWSVGIVLIAAGLWYRQRQAKIRIQEKLDLQERLADAELASKRLQMNPHFLFNALDAISNFIFKNQPKDAVQYMGKLAKMMRLTLDSSRSSAMVVADEKELIEQYLDLCILRYGDFEKSVTIDENLDPYDYKVPPMLVQPLVENAVQHAIRPQLSDGRQGRISVHFGLDGPSVCVKVVDNGGGFNPAEKSSKSHGLSIIEERLDLLSKKHGGDFSLSFRQLGDEHSPNGMEVSLILSLENDV